MTVRRRLAWAAAGLGALGVSVVGGTIAGSAYFAALVVTPDHRRPPNAKVLGVALDDQGRPTTVTLAATAETVAPGRYGLWSAADTAYVVLGEIVSRTRTSVTRRVEPAVTAGVTTGVTAGVPTGEPSVVVGPAIVSGFVYVGDPGRGLGVPFEDVRIDTQIGPMPAWRIDPGHGSPAGQDTWAVLVHGRGATREECLRAVPVLRELGITSLVPAYRNDVDGLAALDGRYGLGLTEWRDVEAAMTYAHDHGARRVVLMGWSMGGAIVLQTLTRSTLADSVSAVILDSPVIDWYDVLEHQAEVNRAPAVWRKAALAIISTALVHRLVGAAAPLDLRQTDWVTRSGELTRPMLIIHSCDDEVVPSGPSQHLARMRPDLVRLDLWQTARHCREWNLDADRWDRVVRDYLRERLATGQDTRG